MPLCGVDSTSPKRAAFLITEGIATMTRQISWVKANLKDAKIASLIKKITKSEKAIETGGCGCGCGDDAPAASQPSE